MVSYNENENAAPKFNPMAGGKFLKELLPEEAFVVALYAIGVPVHMFHFATAISDLTGCTEKGKFFNGKLFVLSASDRNSREELSSFSIFPKQSSPSVFKDYPRILELLVDDNKMDAIRAALIPQYLTFAEALRNPVFMAVDVNARAHWLLRMHNGNPVAVAKMIGDYVLAENPTRPWDVNITDLVGRKFAPFCPDIVGALSNEFNKYINEKGRIANMSTPAIMNEIQSHHAALTNLYQALGEQNGQRNY